MPEKYEIIYDFCDPFSDFNSAHNLCETFTGTYSEMQNEIKKMKEEGCYNIDVNCLTAE